MKLIDEHIGQFKISNWDNNKEKSVTKSLMNLLSSERKEGEKVYEYEARMKEEVEKLFNV